MVILIIYILLNIIAHTRSKVFSDLGTYFKTRTHHLPWRWNPGLSLCCSGYQPPNHNSRFLLICHSQAGRSTVWMRGVGQWTRGDGKVMRRENVPFPSLPNFLAKWLWKMNGSRLDRAGERNWLLDGGSRSARDDDEGDLLLLLLFYRSNHQITAKLGIRWNVHFKRTVIVSN